MNPARTNGQAGGQARSQATTAHNQEANFPAASPTGVRRCFWFYYIDLEQAIIYP